MGVPQVFSPKLIEHFVTVGGLGRLPKAPGTFGTLAGIPLAYGLSLAGPIFYLAATIVILILAIFACEIHERQTAKHDAQHIVIDEVVGYLIAFAWLPLTWQSLLAAFVVFRFFDILKPYPISVLDARVKGGLGVMIDDVAAGLAANIILQALASRSDLLGGYGVFR
ncbi:MAG: phosphatidylglycerophosphatase A [Bdellovibrionales bacterium]|nr:phosphatidylglycerophosphatase A [Bdellovibrionales bacterium]